MTPPGTRLGAPHNPSEPVRDTPLCTTTISASGGMGTACTERSEKSMSRARPSVAADTVSWSRRPLGTPVAACSARWHALAMTLGSAWKPSASARATSRAALDDIPAPTGKVVSTVPRPPVTGRTTATTPATSRAQRGCTSPRYSGSSGTCTSRSAGSGSPAERSTTRRVSSGVKSTTVPRSTAMPMARPSL